MRLKPTSPVSTNPPAAARLLVLSLSFALFTCQCFAQDSSPTPQADRQPKAPTKVTPDLAIVPEGLPTTAFLNNGSFDYLSWETFVALNWPAARTGCLPDLNKTILSGQGPVVWETYLADTDIFVNPKTAKPADWCRVPPGTHGLSAEAQELSKQTGVTRFFGRLTKFGPNFTPGIHGIKEVHGPLTDRNGRFVRYEVRVNQDEYNYILKNNLWNKAGQVGKTIKFPEGKTEFGPVGAMEIKAAWKVLGDGDDPARYYTIQAIVFNDDAGAKSPGKNPVTLGLIGLHILHKARSQSNWVWSTFEQNDNTKAFSYPQGPPNVQTAATPYKELDSSGKPLNKPVNVVRVNPVENPATEMNAGYQKLLAGSVWANYSLVATQWSGETLLPNPPFLANTVIETYTQGPSPTPTNGPSPYNPFGGKASSSCLKCHGVATAQGTTADRSFLLGDAK